MTEHSISPKILLPHAEIAGIHDLGDYRRRHGFDALRKAFEVGPAGVLTILKESGLRNRDGTFVPTGLKWDFVAATPDPERFVLLRADEGEPGSFRDRFLLEHSPFLVLESLLIASFTISAKRAFLFVRHDSREIIERLRKCLDELRRINFLGENIMGKGFSCDIEILVGAGVYSFGQESVILETLEGLKGETRSHVPYPALSGFHDHPTLIGDLETFCFTPFILREGAEWFRTIGNPSWPGTTLYCVSGRVQRPGVYEEAIGCSIERLLALAGGPPRGEHFVAIAPSGIGSGLLPKDRFGMKLDPANLQDIAGGGCSGIVIALTDACCLVDVARHMSRFFAEETCGRCGPCREGTRRLHEALRRLTDLRFKNSGDRSVSRPEPEPGLQISTLRRLGETLRLTARCQFGRRAAAPVLSLIEYFPEELNAHLVRHECPRQICLR